MGIEPLSFVGISGRGVFDYNVRIYRFMDTLAENNRITMKTMECVIDVAVINTSPRSTLNASGPNYYTGISIAVNRLL